MNTLGSIVQCWNVLSKTVFTVLTHHTVERFDNEVNGIPRETSYLG